MANVIKDMDYFDHFFADLIQEILGTTQDKVRISYAHEGQPSFKLNEDICFVHVEPEQNLVSEFKNRDLVYMEEEDEFTQSHSSMRMLNLKAIFYGPNSVVNAHVVCESIYFNSISLKLKEEDLAIVTSRARIVKTHEEINSRWWDRVDLDLYFYNSIVLEENIPPIDEVNIIIDSNI